MSQSVMLMGLSSNGVEPDGRSGILRITQDGQPVGPGILGDSIPLSLYYAYGIRNSFGLAVDPVTSKLWDTENGPGNSDEINLVEPGFNSGWRQLMGPLSENKVRINDLVMFPGSHYSDPVFSFAPSLGVTDIQFFNSTKLGDRYANNIFVGDINHGNLYFFTLNAARTGFIFDKNEQNLLDRVANGEKNCQK